MNFFVNRIFLQMLLLLVFMFLSKRIAAQKASQLHKEIEKALVEEKLIGAVWSVVDINEKIIVDAAGIKNNKTKVSLEPTDKVYVGSIAKTILAVGIMKLATEKRLKLSDPVEKYLPGISIVNKWEKTNPITIRHLLDHTAGLSDLRFWQLFSQKVNPDSPLAAAFSNDNKILEVQAPPGYFFSYSNIGYTLLGMVIEAVTEERYEYYLDTHLLAVLGMENSSFTFSSQEGANADTLLAWGHLDNNNIVKAVPNYLRPAGQFITTAYDMGVFIRFLLSNGIISRKVVVDSNFLMQMGLPNQTVGKKYGLPYGYALGARTRDRYGSIGLMHAGNVLGFSSMLYWFKDTKQGFFIAHNQDSEKANYEKFYEILIRNLSHKGEIQEANGKTSVSIEKWEGYYIPVISKVTPFAYIDLLTGFTKISSKNNKIVLSFLEQPSIIIFSLGKNLFKAEGRTVASHLLYEDSLRNKFIIDGVGVKQKVNDWYLYTYWTSCILGLIGLLSLFLYGCVQIVKIGYLFVRHPTFPSFFGIGLFVLAVTLLILQPFMSLGDLTIASGMLFVSTIVLPLGLICSVIQALKLGFINWPTKLHFLLILLVLQWVVVLGIWGLIPFKLWQ